MEKVGINIKFNKPYITGKEIEYINDVLKLEHVSGNGVYTKKCQNYFQDKYGIKKALLTTSCTDALEMCAILAGIKPGDEVILPSFTFVSTAIAFLRQGAILKFVDSRYDHPGMDENLIEDSISENTKAIVVVHYAGVACNMEKIGKIAQKYNLIVIEDAAQAIESKYRDKYLGSIGDLGAFSFHETKNISSGEGGMLVVNNDKFVERAEIIWEKGTNRAKFFRGEIDKYGWVDIGSSFLPSEIIAAYLWAQLENVDIIQEKRLKAWNIYNSMLEKVSNQYDIKMPYIPNYATNNGHMFYLIFNSLKQRTSIIEYLKSFGIRAVFHYQSLHKSNYWINNNSQGNLSSRKLKMSDHYSDCLLRLPLYADLNEEYIDYIVNSIENAFERVMK